MKFKNLKNPPIIKVKFKTLWNNWGKIQRKLIQLIGTSFTSKSLSVIRLVVEMLSNTLSGTI